VILVLRVGMLGCGLLAGRQELLTAMLAAKVECLAIPFGTAGRRLVDRHSANRINRHAIDSTLHVV
jgi:hypothetical protein